ncbi:AMP-binding, conserved site,AMP-dependent synthetase/ligase,AMP-binding enzyme, C-terminal domain [Cinara cedri]|uniref:Luciferin 4-monooxygenase n=1 Tax=Cinara cedri TaxID=506608 RepID=A0A5E4MM07_9HEMI|nr:AMP-binding, conserved site,AMP-dependent synthetase/ligase,AMP-binding enzyme, C-terminal domain [Cinara cedri]
MDRLSVMKSARHLFNGPLRKCSKTAASNYRRTAMSSPYVAVRTFSVDASHNSPSSSSGSVILESPFGSVKPVDLTLPEYIWKNVENWEDKPMITCGSSGRTYTYGEGRMICRLFASTLISKLGLKKGDVVGLLLPNIPEYVFAIHGALEAGLVVTFVNPLYTAMEVKRQFENAQVKLCMTISLLLPVIQEVAPSLKNYTGTIVFGGEEVANEKNRVYDFKTIVSGQSPEELPESYPDEVALLPYSSGTTGLPKGVMLTHRNCAVNLEQCIHKEIISYMPTTDMYQERVLSVLPFFHIYGFNGILNGVLAHGLHMITIPKFTPESYIECVFKFKPTFLFVVPSLLLFLASHPSVKPEHLSSIKEITCGAAPASKALIDSFLHKAQKDIRIRQGYGMTESSPVSLYTRVSLPANKTGSTGQLVQSTQARVISLIDGKDLGPHKSGELLVRGPQVMVGYLNNEKATKETVDKDGWLHTGDVAYYDEDEYFFIVDRTKELIKVKGNQVSPTELENLISELKEVADVAVVGIPDVLSGEIPRAFVVKRPGSSIDEKTILNHVAKNVVAYKKLAGGVKFLDIIPRNPSGKILRNELKVFGNNPSEQQPKN